MTLTLTPRRPNNPSHCCFVAVSPPQTFSLHQAGASTAIVKYDDHVSTIEVTPYPFIRTPSPTWCLVFEAQYRKPVQYFPAGNHNTRSAICNTGTQVF